jgi:hypothetical protein
MGGTDEAVKRGDRQGQLAKASVALGVLALVALVGALVVVNAISDGDRWYLPGAAIGLVAVGLGWTARKRLAVGASGRRLAILGVVLGAVPLVTFCVLVIDGVVDGML